MFYYSEYSSPFAELTMASDGSSVCGLWLKGQKYFGDTVAEEMVREDEAGGLPQLREWLDAYFAGTPLPPSTVPLAPFGSSFRQAVWAKLLEIPYGELTTYGAIAKQLKAERGKASALAVGGAVGHNPISIIIPCHRVVGAGGNLTGYAGGLDKKVWLLEHEGVDMSKLYRPKRGTAL